MSWYNYYDTDFPVLVDLGQAGKVEMNVYVDINIDYDDILKEIGEDVWDYVDVVARLLDNYKDYLEEIVDRGCDEGLSLTTHWVIDKWREEKNQDALEEIIKRAQSALVRINNHEIDFGDVA